MEQKLLFQNHRKEWQLLLILKMLEQFLEYAKEENLEAVEVAVVTEEPRLVLRLERKRDR